MTSMTEFSKTTIPFSISVVVPARNEEACIAQTVSAIIDAAIVYGTSADNASAGDGKDGVEVIVVDNLSSDSTAQVVQSFVDGSKTESGYAVQLLNGDRLSCPCARNDGAAISQGQILVFIDADTVIPKHALTRIAAHVSDGKTAGISRYKSLEPGLRAWCWWTFWNYVRELPLPRAKAMPAFMFCTREVFDELGPFDEAVRVGEEWPILAGVYRQRYHQFVYDRDLVVESSSRRMAKQRFGYLRTFGKWVWAVLHVSGRRNYREIRNKI